MELLAGFILGLLGSLHCIGMCGPIALALARAGGKSQLFSSLFYNAGRISTYSIMGLLFGLLGSRLELFGLQRSISITIGALILFAAVLPFSVRIKIISKTGLYYFLKKLKSNLAKLFRNHSSSSSYFAGMLNGLLPCGFVYIAISGSIALGDELNSMFFMMMFGIGTMPLMFLISFARKIINIKYRALIPKLLPAISIALAFMFIVRGLNLGIPFLSPKIESNSHQTEQLICQ